MLRRGNQISLEPPIMRLCAPINQSHIPNTPHVFSHNKLQGVIIFFCLSLQLNTVSPPETDISMATAWPPSKLKEIDIILSYQLQIESFFDHELLNLA